MYWRVIRRLFGMFRVVWFDTTKEQIREAKKNDLLFTMWVLEGRFVDGGGDEYGRRFLEEQKLDLACRRELARRGFDASYINFMLNDFKKTFLSEVKEGKKEMPQALWFLHTLKPVHDPERVRQLLRINPEFKDHEEELVAMVAESGAIFEGPSRLVAHVAASEEEGA